MNCRTRSAFGAAVAGALIVLLCGTGSAARGAPEPEHVHLTATIYRDPFSDQNKVDGPKDFVRGEHLYLRIEGVPQKSPTGKHDDDWHTYPVLPSNMYTDPSGDKNKDQAPSQIAKVTFLNASIFAPLGAPTEKPDAILVDHRPTSTLGREHKEPFVWTWEILLRPTAPPGATSLKFKIVLWACQDNGKCVQETHILSVPVNISTAPALPISPELQAYLAKLPPDPPEIGAGDNKAGMLARLKEILSWLIEDDTGGGSSGSGQGSGLWGTIVTALLGGLISLVTPCVFPMIPVTVSYFLKQGEKTHHSPLIMASVYCLTIVAVLTAGGIALVSVLQSISQHWLTNIFLTGVFVFFALSLLGMYEIMLPSGLADMTSKRQGKGGLAGVIFMALTFSIISFACVGPIYGGFITLEATDAASAAGWLKRILGPLAFAVSFASPFFILALFPSLLHALPKSGSWMNSVKVVMGFLELAAAFKFIRGAELNLLHETRFFTYDIVLGVYIALAVACGLYLLGFYRLPHDHGAPEFIGVPRLIWALVFLSFGFYLLPAMFKDEKGHSHPPEGRVYAWVAAFLLHEEASGWKSDFVEAVAQAEREGKPLFVDFTGVSCNNCKLNENNIFNQPEVESEFKNFVVVRLYTDVVPAKLAQVPDAETAAKFRNDKFDNYALPYYVVLQPTGNKFRMLAAYDKGLIDSPQEFVDFLQKARARAN